VLALRTRLEQRQLLRDRAIDARVVGGLEVQEIDVGVGTPVATVERVRRLEEQRPCATTSTIRIESGSVSARRWKNPGLR
jgi:hypothetical protein